MHSKSASPSPRGKVQHVLIVEDDKELREHMGRILEVGGYRVTGAENGVLALQFLLGAPIDLVITDVNMPKMDGIELTTRMAEEFPKVPVVIMSGSKNTAARLAGLTLPNVKKFLCKPVSLDALIAAVVEVFTQPKK